MAVALELNHSQVLTAVTVHDSSNTPATPGNIGTATDTSQSLSSVGG